MIIVTIKRDILRSVYQNLSVRYSLALFSKFLSSVFYFYLDEDTSAYVRLIIRRDDEREHALD